MSEYEHESKIDMRHLNGMGGCPFKHMLNVVCVGQSRSGQYRCECLGRAPAAQSRVKR